MKLPTPVFMSETKQKLSRLDGLNLAFCVKPFDVTTIR